MGVIEFPWSGVEKAQLHLIWHRATTGKPVQDVATTHVAFRATSGAIADWNGTVTNSDMANVETAANNFWTAIKPYAHSSIQLDQYRWYELKTPTSDVGGPMRVNDITSFFTGAAGTSQAPQVAINLTLETDERKRWGRMCLPLSGISGASSEGRVSTAAVDAVAAAGKAFLDACVTAHMHPIIYSRPTGLHVDVKRLRVDDTYDIVRRRRYEGVPYRKLLTLA